MTAPAAPEAGAPRRLDAPGAPRTLAGAWGLFLRQLGPWMIAIAAVACWSARAYLGDWSRYDALLALIVLAAWPFNEWFIHVFLLHFEPRRWFGRTFDPISAYRHRAHHEDPVEIDLILIPPYSHLVTIPALGLFWWLVTPNLELALTGLATYITLGYHYEWVHFLVHTPYRPRSAFYRMLWRHHRLHHFQSDKHWYGVSAVSGDRLLGTDPEPGAVPRSRLALAAHEVSVDASVEVAADEDAPTGS